MANCLLSNRRGARANTLAGMLSVINLINPASTTRCTRPPPKFMVVKLLLSIALTDGTLEDRGFILYLPNAHPGALMSSLFKTTGPQLFPRGGLAFRARDDTGAFQLTGIVQDAAAAFLKLTPRRETKHPPMSGSRNLADLTPHTHGYTEFGVLAKPGFIGDPSRYSSYDGYLDPGDRERLSAATDKFREQTAKVGRSAVEATKRGEARQALAKSFPSAGGTTKAAGEYLKGIVDGIEVIQKDQSEND
jgi:hypothetical protein